MTESDIRLTASKRPRHYAANYMNAKGKDAQTEALKGCPVEWQGLVKQHIKNTRDLTNGRANKNSIKRK
jgi:hypothetical protein